MNKIKNKKVVVAMSGGVDSSVAAAILKRAGFDVIGVFMKFWKESGVGENRCCSSESEKRARKVAKILKIPFYVFNFEREFKQRIVDNFLKEYKKGKTPNPCVACNREIKFGLLIEKALSLGAAYVATGHYARVRRAGQNFKLLRAHDKEKDQSYFLWMLNQAQLKKVLFPVGYYTRREVEVMARKFKLPVLSAKKSVEICFIPKTIEDFLKNNLKDKSGNIITKDRKIIGKHQGLWFYTIGQRKGIKLPGGPYYVIAKNPKRNLLIVSKNKKDLVQKELVAKNINWILMKEPKLPIKVKAKIRYRHESAPATLYKLKNNNYKLIFSKPQFAITPGQSVVFQKGEELLGGGIIK